MKITLILFTIIVLSAVVAETEQNTTAPILVIHGIGAFWPRLMINYLEANLTTYVRCYPIGVWYPPLFDVIFSIRQQGQILWDSLHVDDNLKNGNFSVLAISQGSILAKYVIEYCPFQYPVRTLVTFGGPHMGVSAVPRYPRDSFFGGILNWTIDLFVYWGISQRNFAPANYWRNPDNMEKYYNNSQFLAEANNEINFNQTRKDLWLSLKKAVFVKWEDDKSIIPNESSWWGEYTSNHTEVDRFHTEVYQKDLIGIKTLEESGRAEFKTLPGDHIHYSHDQIHDIVQPVFTI